MENSLRETTEFFANAAMQNAINKGFHDEPRSLERGLLLWISEIIELFEGNVRDGDPESVKIPGFSQSEEEAADLQIRLWNESKDKGWRLADAVLAKMKYNAGRPYKHGRKA